jgi:hypothetical protein
MGVGVWERMRGIVCVEEAELTVRATTWVDERSKSKQASTGRRDRLFDPSNIPRYLLFLNFALFSLE